MGIVIGVLGGFAPEGAAEFVWDILRKAADGESRAGARIIVDYRIGGLDEAAPSLKEEQRAYEELLERARAVERAGADHLTIPCIEAHCCIGNLKSQVGAHVIDALDCTARYIKGIRKRDSTVGVLASSAAISAGIFKEYFNEFRLIYPPKDIQNNLVMEAIVSKRGIKAEEAVVRSRKLLKEAAGYLIYMGAQLLVSGSSEISSVLRQEHVGVCMVDPMKILRNAVLDLIKDQK